MDDGGLRGGRPNKVAAGGASRLTEAGVQVTLRGVGDQVAGGPLREWLHKQRTGLPHVTWKYASSVDGRSAAADGTSQWISSEASRLDLHRRRARADAIVVGTGTVLADDPALTARLPDGSLADRQPLRVVVGMREIPPEAKVLNDDSRTMVIRTHDPMEVIKALSDRTDVLLEGGPTLAGAFLRAGASPYPGLPRADAAGRPGLRGRRRRGAHPRAGVALALRRDRPRRAGSAAQPGAARRLAVRLTLTQ